MDVNYYTRGEKEYLLKIARETLKKHFYDGEKLEPQTVNQKLWEKQGVFVSLYKGKELKGCIGFTEPAESVILAVRDNVLSAIRDSRFSPVMAEELEDIKIEISILTDPEKVNYEDIKTGDGVIIEQGTNKATYLPQVWQELPDREKFFSSLCQKAGLKPSCHKDKKTRFYCYQVVVFREGKI